MDKAISKNTESLKRKNPLRARHFNLSTNNRSKFKRAYMRDFEISERAYYHRLSGRDELSKEEIKYINSWSVKKR